MTCSLEIVSCDWGWLARACELGVTTLSLRLHTPRLVRAGDRLSKGTRIRAPRGSGCHMMIQPSSGWLFHLTPSVSELEEKIGTLAHITSSLSSVIWSFASAFPICPFCPWPHERRAASLSSPSLLGWHSQELLQKERASPHMGVLSRRLQMQGAAA